MGEQYLFLHTYWESLVLLVIGCHDIGYRTYMVIFVHRHGWLGGFIS